MQELTPLQVFENQLKSYRKQITLLSPKGFDTSKFLAHCATMVSLDEGLLDCERNSLIGALMTCAEMGLPPNTPDNLVRLKTIWRNTKTKSGKWTGIKEVRVDIGYQGWIQLMRSGEVIKLTTEIVYENDFFGHEEGLSPKLSHTPVQDQNRGDRKAVYAIAWMKNGATEFTVVYKKEIDMIKANALKNDPFNSVWKHEEKDPNGWMWKKTAIKQLAKKLPKNNSIQKAVHLDNMAEAGAGNVSMVDGNPVVQEPVKVSVKGKEKVEEMKSFINKDRQVTIFNK